jgi:hypothetical protein
VCILGPPPTLQTCASALEIVVNSTTQSLKLVCKIEEHTLNFKGGAAFSCEKTSLAWMPTRATGRIHALFSQLKEAPPGTEQFLLVCTISARKIHVLLHDGAALYA